MYQTQQKRILKILNTINRAQSLQLYEDAQVGANAIVEFIVQVEGKGTKTVALLMEYCELLLTASKGEVSDQLLKEKLYEIGNSVRVELKPDKFEIVFLPYQLSMFDSFETIYLAASKDPNCEVYCVPIPWFERNPDSSLGAMHYDGD